MKKELAKTLTASVVTIIVLSILATLPTPVKAASGPVITVEPATVSFTTEDVTVGDWFTVDVKVSNTEAWKLMMFQVTIKYKQAYLSPSYKGSYIWAYPSGNLGVTPPENWDPAYVFYGSSGTIGSPAMVDGDPVWDGIMLGETLLSDKNLNAGTYLLARFNFTIKAVPGKGESISFALDINNDGTFLYELMGEIMTGPNPSISNGQYSIAWSQPPAPDLLIERADGQPWPLVFPEYQDAVGQTFEVKLRLLISPAWGLTNATLTLNYNETLIEIVGGAANVTIDPFWSDSSKTFGTGSVTIFVKADTAPGPDALIATIKFTVMYQGVFPQIDTTNISLSGVELWDHQYAITPGTLGLGQVTIKGRTQLPDPDVNDDGKVDMVDIYLVALHFGRIEGELGYDANYDMNGDKVIDIRDLYKVASHFGTGV
ncbi:MAG: dockerin type I domain-containing protein [Candidatus Bathyarchaeia archaeon]